MEAGVYSYKSASREGRFAVNLFDEGESQIASRLSMNCGQRRRNEGQESTERRPAGFSLWPLLLVGVFILLALEFFLAFRTGISLYPIVARAVALAALVLALVNPRIFKTTNALDVVVGVDLSRSVGTRRARESTRDSRSGQPHERTGDAHGAYDVWPLAGVGISAREGNSLWRISPRAWTAKRPIFRRRLQAALAQMGEDRQGKILLLSDGNENRGETARDHPLLRSQGAQVWTLPVRSFSGQK